MTANTPTPDSVAPVAWCYMNRDGEKVANLEPLFGKPPENAARYAASMGYTVALLYASLPPPGVPVERVRALSAEWREDAARLRRLAGKAQQRGDLGDADFRSMAAQDADGYADQLDALAQEGT